MGRVKVPIRGVKVPIREGKSSYPDGTWIGKFKTWNPRNLETQDSPRSLSGGSKVGNLVGTDRDLDPTDRDKVPIWGVKVPI